MAISSLMGVSLLIIGCLAFTGCTQSSMHTRPASLPDTTEPHWAKNDSKTLTSVTTHTSEGSSKPRLSWAGQRIQPIQQDSLSIRSESSSFIKKSPVVLQFEHERGYYTTSVEGLTKKIADQASH